MMKQLHFKSLIIATLFVFANLLAISQNYETSKTLTKTAGVTEDVGIKLSNHSGDIKFTTNTDNTVTVKTNLKVSAKKKEDADKLIAAIENFKFESDDDLMQIDTRFYKNMQSINGRSTITLKNGEKVKIKDFEIRHEVSIPVAARLNLENKYSTVILPTLNGKTKLNLYSSKLRAGDFNNETRIETKYSKLQVENFKGNASLSLYDTDIQFKTSDKLKITSKYSKVEAEKTGTLVLESYDDKFYINEFGDLSLTGKYSDLKSNANVNSLKLELYDCNVSLGSAKAVSFNGKYCDLKLGNVSNLKIDDSYDNDLTFSKTKTISIGKSKYSKYILDENSAFSIDDTYDDDIRIEKLNADFSGISLNGKYTKLDATAGSVPFKIDVNMKYGKVDLPESVKISKHIEKSSQLEMLGGESGETVSIRGYDNTIIIR